MVIAKPNPRSPGVQPDLHLCPTQYIIFHPFLVNCETAVSVHSQVCFTSTWLRGCCVERSSWSRSRTLKLDWCCCWWHGQRNKPSGGKLFGHMTLKLLFGHNEHQYVWRTEGEAFRPKNTTPTVHHGAGSVLLWGGSAKLVYSNSIYIEVRLLVLVLVLVLLYINHNLWQLPPLPWSLSRPRWFLSQQSQIITELSYLLLAGCLPLNSTGRPLDWSLSMDTQLDSGDSDLCCWVLKQSNKSFILTRLSAVQIIEADRRSVRRQWRSNFFLFIKM